jgi:hypothetical protein
MPTSAIATFGVGILVPLKNPEAAVLEVLALKASTTFPSGQVLYEQAPGVYDLYTGAQTLVGPTTAITLSGTTATFTVANTLVAGQYVLVSGAVPDGYNGFFQVATAAAGSFTVANMPAGLVTPATAQGVVRTQQQPTHLMQYACITDASGNVTFGSSIVAGAAEWGQTSKAAPAFRTGYFNCADLVGLDNYAVRVLGRIVQGTIAAGHFVMNGN